MFDPDVCRVLVCLRYGIGDVVMEMPILEALRRTLPRARITALGAFPATQLLERNSVVDEVVRLDDWGFRHRWDPGPPGAPRMIARWLDERDFQLFYDVTHVTPTFGAIIWGRGIRSIEASEAAERAAIGRGESGVAAIHAAVQEGWGIDLVEGAEMRITPREEDRDFADTFLRRHALNFVRPLAISAVASLELKRWPIERLARIAGEMVDASGDPLVVFAGPQPEPAERLAQLLPLHTRVVPVGALHLLRVAAILEHCRAFVCNDTGLMHLAAAVGLPTLAIFGPTRAAIYRPPARQTVAIEAQSVQCSYRDTASLRPPPCFADGHCLVAEGPCIRRVSEAEVRIGIEQLLCIASSREEAQSVA